VGWWFESKSYSAVSDMYGMSGPLAGEGDRGAESIVGRWKSYCKGYYKEEDSIVLKLRRTNKIKAE
jgi:hypothetical protein